MKTKQSDLGAQLENEFGKLKELLTQKGDDYAANRGTWWNFEVARDLTGLTMEQVFLVRLSEKMGRLGALSQSQHSPIFESTQDTWRDIAGYALLFLAYIQDQKDLINNENRSDSTDPSPR